jgi:hypothetical protein
VPPLLVPTLDERLRLVLTLDERLRLVLTLDEPNQSFPEFEVLSELTPT